MKNTDIKKILVPVDFTETSEAAINEAVIIAKELKAQLFIIHVVEYLGYYFSVVPETQTIHPSIIEMEKVVQKKMEAIQKKIKATEGIVPVIFVTTGHIHDEIISFSNKKKIDLIIMGTHGASGYKELFIGSNAQRIVTLSDIPVLTMRKKKRKAGFKNILLPIDNSLHSREKVNLTILIAQLFNAKIHILGLPDSADTNDLNKINIKLDSVEKLITAGKLSHKTTIVHEKSLAKAAMDYAEKRKCDLIVINTGHESELTGIFLGAFAQQIVNHAKIPVLSFRHTEGHFTINIPGFGI